MRLISLAGRPVDVRTSSLLLVSIALALSSSSTASAAGGAAHERYKNDQPGDQTVDDTPRFRPLTISVDLMIGFGRSTVAQLAHPDSGFIQPRAVLDDRAVFVESWLFGLSYDFGRGFGAALRFPFSYMSFPSDTVRVATSSAGNLELEPSYRRALNDTSSILFALGLTAPTAQGVAPPVDPNAKLDQNDTNRFLVQHAASATRGLEYDAYFAHQRFGVSPRVAIDLHPFAAPITVTPYAKVELLFDTGGAADHALASDGVLGAIAAFRPDDMFTFSLRAFGVVPLAGRDDHRVALVVAPDMRAEGHRFLGGLGLLIPIIGPGTDPRFTGVHGLVGVKF